MMLLGLAGVLPTLREERIAPVALIDENGIGGVEALADEPNAETPAKAWFPGWKADRYPVSVTLDLGSRCRVSRVSFYCESGESNVGLATGEPFAWKEEDVSLKGYRNWIDAPVGVETRWLRIVLKRPTSLPEIAVFGERREPLPPQRKPKPSTPGPTMDGLIGTNAFIDDPIERIAPVGGFVREYHNFSWDFEGPDRLVRFQPSGAAGGNAWFFDDYYAKLKAAGCEVVPCVQNAPTWMFGTSRGEDKPLPKDADPTDPRSYRVHAAHLFQFAARYGSRRVPDAELKLAPGQPRRSGLGLLRWLENWNEPDKNWWGRASRFDPYELAAMCSADYDGDQGRMGSGVGAKSADPTIRLALGGLAGIDLGYLRAMKLWSDRHRGGSFPADALNLHHYSTTTGDQGFTKDTVALSPEADRLRERLAKVVAWRDAELPGKEVWLSEFGYDLNPGSPLYARPLGTMSSEEVQAAWIVRAYLALAAARVDRAAQFMLRDVDPKDKTQFSSSGLVGPKGDWTPKPSWTAVAALRKALTGMRFVSELPSGQPDVWIYRFASPKGTADALWCATSADRRVPGFRWKGTRIVDLSDGASKPFKGTLEVSEMPKIVFAKGA